MGTPALTSRYDNYTLPTPLKSCSCTSSHAREPFIRAARVALFMRVFLSLASNVRCFTYCAAIIDMYLLPSSCCLISPLNTLLVP
jgi:hypothetical protein